MAGSPQSDVKYILDRELKWTILAFFPHQKPVTYEGGMKPRTPARTQKKDFQAPSVVFQPKVTRGMQAGFDLLVNAIRPTLGPLPRYVAIEKTSQRNSSAERSDSGGTIARRLIQIAGRDRDVGLMFLRHVLWELFESEGDGTATAAVLFQHIFNRGYRYVAAGGDPMMLRQHLENGMRLVLAELDLQITELCSKKQLAGLARTICYDDELGKILGEIFDMIGAYGRLEIRKGNGRDLRHEYMEGAYWDSELRSREVANAEHGMRANLEDAAILISDLNIESVDQIAPLLQFSVENNIHQVLLITQTISERAIGFLLANRQIIQIVPVKTPGFGTDGQQDALQDIAILTGGYVYLKATGSSLERVRYQDLGRARRAWSTKEYIGILGGGGDARRLRQHVDSLRQAYKNSTDLAERKKLLERLGKLLGGSAVLYVGEYTPTALEARLELSQHTASAIRGALQEGVVPGGGAAFLNCRPALRNHLISITDPDEYAAYGILLEAMEVPCRTILGNAGFRPDAILAEIDRHGKNYGYDVLTRKVVDMGDAGIFDSASVVKGVVRTAIASVALALTTAVIIHRRNPPEQVNP